MALTSALPDSKTWLCVCFHAAGSAVRFSVLINPPTTLSSLPSRVHHLDEQRAGAVFGIAEAVVQHPHDVEADVEADEVGERERAHGMRHAQFEDLVNRFWR